MQKLLLLPFLSLMSLPLSAAIMISQSGEEYTFTFDPAQSAPLSPGFASYDSAFIVTFNLLGWGPANTIYISGGLPVVSNTLIDSAGNPIPDSFVSGGVFNATSFEVLGFGNDAISAFSVAGGSLTLDFSFAVTGNNHTLPNANYGLAFGSYDAGTTGSSGDLLVEAIPEPTTYMAIAGFAGLGIFLWRRRKRVAEATGHQE